MQQQSDKELESAKDALNNQEKRKKQCTLRLMKVTMLAESSCFPLL